VSYDTKVKQALDICLRKNYFKGDKNETAIVMYSGGMDSVSLLWNLLEHTDQSRGYTKNNQLHEEKPKTL
jgi:tRNA(Ile)-lysidine synthase TilS/MesJ